MQLSQSQRLNSRVAAFEIFQLGQVELNGVNIAPFNRRHVLKTANVIARHPAILQCAGIVSSTTRAIGAQKPFNGELSKQVLITVQKTTRYFLLNIDQERAQGMSQEQHVHPFKTRCPAGLFCCMADHKWRYTKPATNFLNAE